MTEESFWRNNRLKIIKDSVEGIDEWFWPKTDQQTWGGIKNDWLEHHSHKWFENVKKFELVLQAGGCAGLYPRLLANRFKWVYTFEPDPLSFHCLVVNNQHENIFKMNACLGNTNGLVGWSRDRLNIGMNRIDPAAEPFIPMIKIDDLNLPFCDLIALDLEGYEVEALQGGANTIEKYKPIIICERNSNARLDIDVYLPSIGYRFHQCSSSDNIYLPT